MVDLHAARDLFPVLLWRDLHRDLGGQVGQGHGRGLGGLVLEVEAFARDHPGEVGGRETVGCHARDLEEAKRLANNRNLWSWGASFEGYVQDSHRHGC